MKNMDKNIMEQVRKRNKTGIEEAVRKGYLETDAEFMNEDVNGGSCCVTALIREGDLIVSNVGDCRAVLSREGTAEALTSDHKASVECERERIQESVSEFLHQAMKAELDEKFCFFLFQLSELLNMEMPCNSAGRVCRLLSWCLEDTRLPSCVEKHRG